MIDLKRLAELEAYLDRNEKIGQENAYTLIKTVRELSVLNAEMLIVLDAIKDSDCDMPSVIWLALDATRAKAAAQETTEQP